MIKELICSKFIKLYKIAGNVRFLNILTLGVYMFEWVLEYFNHPLLQDPYIKFGVIIATFAVASVIIAFVIKNFIKKLTANTKTDVDDRIVAKIGKPIISLIILIGVGVGILSLGLEGDIAVTVGHVMTTLYILVGMYIVIVIASIVIEAWGKSWAAKTESTLDDSLLPIFHKVSKIVLLLIALMLILSEWEVNITGFVAGVGVAGIAIGFAVKDSLANIFGGLSIIMDGEYHVGDVIELKNGTAGTVVDIGLRSTRIKTWDNELVIIPNGQIANTEVINKKLPDLSIRIVIPFGVEYGADIEKVKSVVLKALEPIDALVKEGDRAPKIIFTEMGASALNFKAYMWVDDLSKKFSTKEKANIAIYNALNGAGIVIPYQTFTVYNKKE